jgi:AraC-like DNA-binding protein
MTTSRDHAAFAHPQPRVVGPYLQTALDTARESGVSLEQLADALGLADNALTPTPEALPVQTYIRLLQQAAELSGDADFGLHVGERMRLATYAVYGMIVLACPTFGEAVAQVMRYESLAHDLGTSRIEQDGNEALYVWDSPWLAEQPCRHLPESVTAGIMTFVNWIAGQRVPVIEIGFTHAAPERLGEYQRIFQAPVRFNAGRNYARFSAEILSWPVPNADASVAPILKQHAEELLRARAAAGQEQQVIHQVRELLVQGLAHDRARLPLVAEQLGMTPRTLQRKLKEHQISFQQLLDDTRMSLAERYLQDPRLSLTEIAFMLGFQEQSSFNHAFKDWTGLNPGAYRQQHGRA